MIRIDSIWLATAPIDMRCGADTALMRVISVFGAAQLHHAYVFTNRSQNRLKVLVQDGVGIWLASRRLHQGKFAVSGVAGTTHSDLSVEQLSALVLGLPWQHVGPIRHY